VSFTQLLLDMKAMLDGQAATLGIGEVWINATMPSLDIVGVNLRGRWEPINEAEGLKRAYVTVEFGSRMSLSGGVNWEIDDAIEKVERAIYSWLGNNTVPSYEFEGIDPSATGTTIVPPKEDQVSWLKNQLLVRALFTEPGR
jgi:hypothetical protein